MKKNMIHDEVAGYEDLTQTGEDADDEEEYDSPSEYIDEEEAVEEEAER